MPTNNKLTIFASGNGDTIMLEALGRTILTDIHYRRGQAEDDENDNVPDFASDIRAACPDDHLHIFVLTHPDKDHLGGFCDLFHCGDPAEHDPDPKDDEPKIIVDEIWCSPHTLDPHYTTAQSKPLIDEIKRRDKLRSKKEGDLDGNRLVVMDTTTDNTGEIVEGLEWRLLAPNKKEWDIPEAEENESPTSTNSTSLVIQWTVTLDGHNNFILLGGDSTVEVWERLDREVRRKNKDHLAWHILVAVHHCSRRSIGRVNNDGNVDEEFEESEGALRALGEQRGDGFVVSSSKRIVRGAQTPPSFHAKNRYLKILARGGDVTDAIRKRFLCTGGDSEDDTPAHVVFYLTSAGPTRSLRRKSAATASSAALSSVGRGGGYGVG